MPIQEDLLEILVCPETKVPVEMMPDEMLAGLNAQIEKGAIQNVEGKTLEEPIKEALVTTDGKTAYRIDDNVPVMLIGEGIAMGQLVDA